MLLRTIARPLLGTAFVASGVDALRAPAGPARVAEPLLDSVPAESETVIRAAGAVQVAAGVALAAGKAPRLSSAVLAGTLVPTTVFASDFWNETDPALKSAKRSEFVKNLGLLGGALIASADTEGRPSLGWRGRRRLESARTSVVDALPSGAQRQSAWDDVAERTSQWAGTAADRAQDVADQVADRAPEVIDTVRDRAGTFADQVVDRAPEVADRARDLAERAGEETAVRTRRWRRALADR
ncbi:DoxX family membrane protein [Gordonia shandongensis]|uniref:DoxX family membrane protein n=1 Tax=Gordonia shandongensis TaxID=376351 RepID=UPI00042A0008|nr:DoxX family membrane protein [Gordonia shandongensis]